VNGLEATSERIAAAQRARGRDWTFGPEGTVAIATDPVLGEMVGAGLIAPHFVSPDQQINGQDDYYRLTEGGEKWLAENGGGA
jgi:DNA-binding PadR family transcriptional regulator